MNKELKERLELFISNTQGIRKDFVLQNTLAKRLATLICTTQNKAIDCAAIRENYELIKKNTGVFSVFRGDMAICIATMLSLMDKKKERLSDTLAVYDMMKELKFRTSDFLAVAAYQIAVNTEHAEYTQTVERARAFYDGMKENHMFYTGSDDYIFAAMLAISDIDVKAGVERMEILYKRLKPDFSFGNSVQALTQVMVLGGETEESVGRIFKLRDMLRDKKLRLDREYTLSSLGLLALLPADASEIVTNISDSHDFLREQKGFGVWSATKQEVLLFSSALVVSTYVNGLKDSVIASTVSTSIANIIIAQQAAIIAASAASVAAASSASN